MPRNYAKRSRKPSGFKSKAKRRLQGRPFDREWYNDATAAPTAKPRGNLRGKNPYGKDWYESRYGSKPGPKGKAKASVRKANSTNSAVNGFVVGKSRAKTKGAIVANRKKSIMQAIMDEKYPVVSKHAMIPVNDIDWANGSQGVTMYQLGYDTVEVETCIDQGNAAQYVPASTSYNPSGMPNVDTATQQRVHINPKKSIFTFKNTCTHTVTMDLRLYKVKGFHSNDFISSWTTALLADNALSLLVSQSGTQEEITTSIGCRPDMRNPELQGRFTEVREGRGTVVLEPGQETQYTHHCEGFRYDKALWNVLQGGTTDAAYMSHTYFLMAFCKSELVTDSLSDRQTLGSGHVAVIKEEFSSFQALPYMKPVQKLFYAGWSQFAEAQEEDINQYPQANQIYVETV